MGRYKRHVNLKGFGQAAQEKLAVGKVLIVGLGGLGVPVAQYLNAMGVGSLGLVDGDQIELNNLQRQVLYSELDVGQLKVKVAKAKLSAQNSETDIAVYEMFLSVENALDIIAAYDVVVDATDNFATRYLINDACMLLDKPFVYGALHAFEGQVSVFNYLNGPSYRCLYPKAPSVREIPNCNDNGILGVLPGIVGNLQALEVVKVLCGIGEVLTGKLLIYDGWSQRSRQIYFKRNPIYAKISKLSENYGFNGCESVSTIAPEIFAQLQGNVQLIDVRNADEFNTGHRLPNAISIPLTELKQNSKALDVAQEVYLICQTGKRSKMACQLLKQWYPNIKATSVEGGMDEMMRLCP
ncbi:Sulfur carrier protein adenylyltransferase ThiF [Croceitalea dokdonensis DOKDO 023]|uniref:Molybdopterin-synthase adenylyltransferase n=1 Tax=Croceitalea dokdonensis DOKDO 023 TaxID=1300341 RepID=A0A0P7B458_9FLAO|nr:HesA/MoeB/ThiF family protein [Croceitalea dokdonensis]KPM33457.1 Sulfur carrier protein adenylyltransferase ThiF [Croceitalea dokdonensis DOKDO 023]